MSNGADVLVDGLARHGFRHLFGMPGSHSTSIYDALRRQGSISTILTRNEQAGAFAADGYARATGKPGLICTTAGPGATNALTGLAECWADSVPVLLIAGQVNSDRIHQECGAYHEIELESIFRPVTRWCGTLRNVEDIPEMLAQAIRAMTCGRPRPVALFLPQDLMRTQTESPAVDFHSFQQPSLPEVPLGAIAELPALLAAANRPIILVGGGALWGEAAVEVRALAERLGAPIVTSLNGKGIIDEQDPYSLGHARSARAKEALPHADAMLAIGCRFTEVMTDWRRMPVPSTLIQIDLDPEQIGMNHPVSIGIEADAKASLGALLQALPEAIDRHGWDEIWPRARAARPARPEWLIEALREVLPESTPLFTDACEMGYRCHTDWTVNGPRRFFYPSNYITLGWGFPAAIGAAVGLEGRPVVSISGDGGFVMTLQELATASRYRLPLIAIVHNDSTYGAIKNLQQRAHEERYLDVELNNPDFLKLADSFDVPSARAADAIELKAAVAKALARSGPWLIEVPDRWRYFRT